MTLEKMQQQIALGYLQSPDDIRAVLKHTLKRDAEEITFLNGKWLGTLYKSEGDKYAETFPKKDTAIVLDVLVMTDWLSMHGYVYGLEKQFRCDLMSIARLDPWFGLFMDISVNALAKYLMPKASYPVCNELVKNYSAVNGCFLSDDITVGGLLNGLKGKIDKSWQVTDDIFEYKDKIIGCCRLVLSLIHMICCGFVDVDKRAASADFPYKSLTDAILEENEFDKRTERSAERLDE